MKLAKREIWIVIGIILIYFVFCCGPHESSAIPVSVGETVTFQFDFGVTDLSQYFAIGHFVNASSPAPGLFTFSGTVSVYDELGTAPVAELSSTFADTFGIIRLSAVIPGLFDDPISYLSINLTGLIDNNFNSLNQADFSPFATAFGNFGTPNVTVSGVNVEPSPVPEPGSTLIFLVFGLVSLWGAKKKFKK